MFSSSENKAQIVSNYSVRHMNFEKLQIYPCDSILPVYVNHNHRCILKCFCLIIAHIIIKDPPKSPSHKASERDCISLIKVLNYQIRVLRKLPLTLIPPFLPFVLHLSIHKKASTARVVYLYIKAYFKLWLAIK